MTVDQPDFDPKLEEMNCYVVDSICHASKTIYDEDGEHQGTECGLIMPDTPLHDPTVDMGARKEFIESDDVDMCPECWPDDLLD